MATFPHNWTPEKHQLPVVQNSARFKVLVWHRKAHKTTLAINELFRWANAIKGTYWYVAPFLGQAKKIVWQDPEMGAKYCPIEIWDKKNSSEMYITFPNGSVVYIMGADNPDSLRGPNPKGVVLDEYDDMKQEVWSSIIQPIMTANPKAWTWFVGTPKGKRDLFRKFQYAEDQMRDKGRESEWFCSRLKASDSGIISKEGLEMVRNDPGTPEDFYKQEYEVEFLDGAGTFFKSLQNILYEPEAMKEKLKIHPKKKYQLGIDWAKVNDFTVFTPLDLTNFYVYPQVRFNQIDYNLQQARAEATYLKYNRARVQMDGTGIGTPIFDSLSRSIPRLEEYTFTEQSRKDLLENLKLKIETEVIRIPNDPVLLGELSSFQYYLTPNGKVRIQCGDNQHDDCVMSLALACWDMPVKPVNHLYNEQQEILKQFDSHRSKQKKFAGIRYR